MTAGTVVITGGILATVILLCIIAVLCYCRLQVLGGWGRGWGSPEGGPAGVGTPTNAGAQEGGRVRSRTKCEADSPALPLPGGSVTTAAQGFPHPEAQRGAGLSPRPTAIPGGQGALGPCSPFPTPSGQSGAGGRRVRLSQGGGEARCGPGRLMN